MTEDYMILGGKRYRVAGASMEQETDDGRKYWRVVTEEQGVRQTSSQPYYEVPAPEPWEAPDRYLIVDGKRYKQVLGHWRLDAEEHPPGDQATAPDTTEEES